jgi:hypothetical protein
MSNNYEIYAFIAGGVTIAVASYYYFKKDHDTANDQPKNEKINFDENIFKFKINPLLNDYYSQALSYHIMLFSIEKKVPIEIMMVVQKKYGIIAPRPFIEWNRIANSRQEIALVERLQEDLDKRARLDAEGEIMELLNNAKVNK